MQDPPLSQEILDHARECAREYPEGMFSAGAMGVTDEDIARLDPARLVSEETRRQALREAFDFVSSGLTYEEFIYERNLASYYSDHEVSEHGDVPDGDSASNPIVIDDDELLNDAYAADDGEVSLAAELDGGDRATHQSNASDDGNFYDFDDGDDVERFEHVSVDASSDSDSSDDSLISEYDQIPDDEAASESGASDDDALEVYETQSDHGDDAEDFSPPHAPEQTVSNDAEMSADSEEYDSDYAQSRPSRVAKARSKSKAIKTAPRTDRVTSKPSNAQSKKTQAPKKKAHRLSSQLSGGDYFSGSTRLLAKKIAEAESSRKRSRSASPSAGSSNGDNPNDYSEDESDSMPLAKKARLQRNSPGINASSGSSTRNSPADEPAQQVTSVATDDLDEPSSPEIRQSLGGKTLPGGKRPYGGKTLPGGKMPFGGKRLPGTGRAVGEKTLPGQMSSFSGKTLPGARQSTGGKTLLEDLSDADEPDADDSYANSDSDSDADESYADESNSRRRATGSKKPLGSTARTTAGGKQPLGSTASSAARNTTGGKQPLGSTTGSASNPAPRGKRSWNDTEHAAIEDELRRLRREEQADGLTGKLGLRDERLWRYIANVLQERHSVDRSLAGCKYYWGRFGRARSGFDERAVQEGKSLSTSVQHKKKG